MDVQKGERARVGARLRGARERAHITAEDAAEAVGVQPIAIRRWEKGAALPTLFELRALLPIYGVTACDILYDDNPWTMPPQLGAELRRASRGFSADLRGRVEVYLAMHCQGIEPIFKQTG